ncbi:MAG: hypothetical protein WCE69_17320 [Aestuariivirga sp.]|jgi:hypothetical protein
MTGNSRNEEQPESLTLARVYRLIALERIAMERRVAERRRSPSNVVAFTPRPAARHEPQAEPRQSRLARG